MADGNWDIPEFGYTYCLRQQEYSQRQLAVASGIVFLVLIPLILLFLYLAYLFLKKRKKEREEEELINDNYEANKRLAQEKAAKKLTEVNDYDDEDDTTSNVTSNVTTASPVLQQTNNNGTPASPTTKNESTIY